MRGKEVLMMQNAEKIIYTCASVKKGEKVLIITDPERLDIAKILTGVMLNRDIEPVTAVMMPNEFDGQEPPSMIFNAMLDADVIIMPVAKSISHSEAVHKALDNGARALAMSAFVEEQMYEGGINADFVKERPVCLRFGDYFTNSDTIHITSPGGTDFTASLKGRKGNSHACIVDEPGMYSSLTNIEANISPAEHSANGTVVVDGAVSNFGIGVVDAPIIMEIENGAIQSISGGKDAKFLDDLLKSIGDEGALNIAQIAIGLNPLIKDFNGIMLNDHGVYGSSHIGIGTSHNLGGDVKADIHYDVMMANPTIKFDGQVVIEEGNVIG
ncbi:MAG: aminopeptidase [Bacillota bacterium]